MELTRDQKKAIHTLESHLMIVAGPGSGKTRVLTEKAAYLINHGIPPKDILLTTFTVKAAEEMRKRIAQLTKADIGEMFIGTLHSLADHLMKEYGETGYRILGNYERYFYIRKHLSHVFSHIKKGDPAAFLMGFYDTLSENYIVGERFERWRDEIAERVGEEVVDSYLEYQEKLEEDKYIDYSLLQVRAYQLLERTPYKKEYVMVDEFQDINPIQWKIIKRLGKWFVVVGDKNQSIYGFRGANPNIFERFEEEFPDALKIYLRKNFRSKQEIVDNLNRFLEWAGRKEMELEGVRGKGGIVGIVHKETWLEEIDWIVEAIKKAKRYTSHYSDI
ncbi:MAG: ATP-dependent helicase, partial [Candidatus Micrarchaeota archaeon]|nr:ATP-dependent helicase [Candidatus Micrarchaeota archaeon]